jgi:hypothetical protein
VGEVRCRALGAGQLERAATTGEALALTALLVVPLYVAVNHTQLPRSHRYGSGDSRSAAM